MSLDVYLMKRGVQSTSGPHIFVREDGQTKSISREEWDRRYPGRKPVVTYLDSDDETLFSANITHNLNRMADEAGIYKALWRPDEIGVTKAAQLVPLLRDGLDLLRSDPERFKKFNPANGWGDYAGLVEFVAEYLEACDDNPEAEVSVSR